MNWTKAEFQRASRDYLNAFQEVARELGYEACSEADKHPLVTLMGGLAWGRHDAERGPSSDTLKASAVEYGFLRGCERMLVKFCNLNNDRKTLRLLLDTAARWKRTDR